MHHSFGMYTILPSFFPWKTSSMSREIQKQCERCHWKSFEWYDFPRWKLYELMNVDECACVEVELFFVLSPICVHLPIYSSVSVCHRFEANNISHFCWPSCRLQMNMNKMNAEREIFRCFVLRGQRQCHYGIRSENSLRPECVVMSFTLLLFNVIDQTGRLMPANTIYVPTYKNYHNSFLLLYHNCKWQCQRVERRTSWRIFSSAISYRKWSRFTSSVQLILEFRLDIGVSRALACAPQCQSIVITTYLFCYESMDAIQRAAYKNTIKFVFYYCRDPIPSHSTTRHKRKSCGRGCRKT